MKSTKSYKGRVGVNQLVGAGTIRIEWGDKE